MIDPRVKDIREQLPLQMRAGLCRLRRIILGSGGSRRSDLWLRR